MVLLTESWEMMMCACSVLAGCRAAWNSAVLEGEPFNDDFSVPIHQKRDRVQIDLG